MSFGELAVQNARGQAPLFGQPTGALAFHAALSRASTVAARPTGLPGQRSGPTVQTVAEEPLPDEAAAEPAPGEAGSAFGPEGAEEGIRRVPYQSGQPLDQIYLDAGFGHGQGDLAAQRAATPGLDPHAFGNRPAAPPDAERRLEEGTEIIVLDEVRLDYLEEQRTLLGQVMPSASTDSQATRRDEQIGALATSIVGEIMYATEGQAVPDIDAVAATIAARAPNDPVFQQALRWAKGEVAGTFQAQGRTPDQIGALLEAGQAGDFARVEQLAKEQLIGAADAATRDLGANATGDAQAAAVHARLGVYATYVTGDPAYLVALRRGGSAALHEVLVERPIREVLAIGERGGEDWADQAMAKLRAVTDPATHTPQQVQEIMADPRIMHLIQQGLRSADRLHDRDAGPIGPIGGSQGTFLADLSVAAQNTFATDQGTPGKGKQIVDQIAAFIVDPANYSDDQARHVVATMVRGATYEAASAGYVVLGLAVEAAARNAGVEQFQNLGSSLHGVRDGVKIELSLQLQGLHDRAVEHGQALTVPLDSFGRTLPADERATMVERMLHADPELRAQIEADAQELALLPERLQTTQAAFAAYAPDLGGVAAFQETSRHLEQEVWPAYQIEPTNPMWLLRSERNFAYHFAGRLAVGSLATRFVADSAYEVLFGPKPGMPATTGDFRALDRVFGHGMLSSALFAKNAYDLWQVEAPTDGDLSDWLVYGSDKAFIPIHTMMAGAALMNAVTWDGGRKWLFSNPHLPSWLGSNPAGLTPNQRVLDYWHAQIDTLRISAERKEFYKFLTTGVAKDPLDLGYALVDGYSALAYTIHGDYWRTLAYSLSVAGDLAFLTGPGALTGGKLTWLNRAAPWLAARSGLFWTGVGTILMLAASGVNYGKGRYDRAHEYDDETADFLRLLGLNDPEVARALSKGKTVRFDHDAPWRGFPGYYPDMEAEGSAGPFLVEAFQRAGYDPYEAMAWINRAGWTPEQANLLADHIKHTTNLKPDQAGYEDRYFADVARFAAEHDIPWPTATA
jgi:hypothetical protein